MEEKIKRLLNLLRKERIIITKMIESEERKDIMLFNALQSKYKEVFDETNEKLNDLFDCYSYNELFEKIATKVNRMVDSKKNVQDIVTLLGLVNTEKLLKATKNFENFSSDVFSNELIMHIYELYLWNDRQNDYSKEFKDAIRNDLVMKVVNSRALRNYFAGNYEVSNEISDSFLNYKEEEKSNIGAIFVSLLGGQIKLSNGFEMFDGTMEETLFNSRKEMLKLEFSAISLMMMKQRIIIPVPPIDYSDFTEQVIRDASEITNKFKERKSEEKQKVIKL